MIPFFFTRYRKAPLATCVSFCSSMCYVLTLVFSVGYFLNWEGIRESGSLGGSLLAAACFAAAGFGLMKLAKWLAIRKQRKLAEKAAATAGTTTTAAATATTTSTAHVPKGRFCPKCGAAVEPGDAFCVNCGAKL